MLRRYLRKTDARIIARAHIKINMRDETYDSYLQQSLPIARELKSLFSIHDNLVIFDIGACEGEDSIRYSRLFPNALIFTFEPLRANQAIIQYQFARHQTKRCELVPLALSDRTGEAVLHVSSGSPENKSFGEDWNYGNKSNSLLPPSRVTEEVPWLKFENTEVVQTETLDHFCVRKGLDRVDFLHIDVQGAESLVLAGAEQMLPKIKALWLEVADKEVYQGQKTQG